MYATHCVTTLRPREFSQYVRAVYRRDRISNKARGRIKRLSPCVGSRKLANSIVRREAQQRKRRILLRTRGVYLGTFGATTFGGSADPGTGSTGYRGDNLNGRMAWAELDMGSALGGLPYGARIRITYGGRSVIASKLDIGGGGGPIGGVHRAVDLWWETAQALGVGTSWSGVVKVYRL